MKISAKARYALRILMDLAIHNDQKLRTVRDISQSQQISEKFISRIIIDLRKAKFISSVRGVKGGVSLIENPEKITLYQILETIEGPLNILDCISIPQHCQRSNGCVVRDFWSEINGDFRSILEKVTLDHIVKRLNSDFCENMK